jgi:hypothetical protein
MHFSNLLAVAALSTLATAAPHPVPQDSIATIQSNIQAGQEIVLTIINDLVQGRSAVATFSAFNASLAPLVTFPCPLVIKEPDTTSTEAIEDLQEVQLQLNNVALAIQDSDEAGAQAAVCQALLYFNAAGGFISTSGSSTSTTTTPTSTSSATPSPTPTDCTSAQKACRAEINANLAFCDAQANDCDEECQEIWDSCQVAPNANHAFCASQYAGCLGYNPFAAGATATSSAS